LAISTFSPFWICENNGMSIERDHAARAFLRELEGPPALRHRERGCVMQSLTRACDACLPAGKPENARNGLRISVSISRRSLLSLQSAPCLLREWRSYPSCSRFLILFARYPRETCCSNDAQLGEIVQPDTPGRSRLCMPADLHATSLDSMEMVVGVEEGFRIEIHDREAAKLVFVADFEL
jgi:hypothetical protein